MTGQHASTFSLRLRSAISVLILLSAWEITARLQLTPPLFLPPFSVVAVQLGRSIGDGTLVADLALSLYRTFAGLALATAVGVFTGMLMSQSRFVHWFVDPIVALAFPSPKIAFIPVFILWFGIESLSKILLVAFACVFPVVIGTYSAARGVGRIFIWSASSLGTSRTALLRRVILPACYPRIFATLRIALPVALITTFTAEMVAGGGGMGATLIYSQRFFDSPTVYAYILVMLCVGLVLDAAMIKFQSRYLAWAE
ncbi:MAG TPA: ABC transporter permease [Pseudolabrys sp.]|nr:ABC transporter permease [Pseudolabrys sp.]